MGTYVDGFVIPLPKKKLGACKTMAKAKPDETVVFAFVLYNSRAHRDRVNKKVMSDPSMDQGPRLMPFDMKKVAFGGFKTIVQK